MTYEGGPTSGAYSTVAIGTQCWMGENLNVGSEVTGATTMTDNSITEKYCYDDTTSNCTAEGGLYQWDEAMGYVETEGAQGICPAGWHILHRRRTKHPGSVSGHRNVRC